MKWPTRKTWPFIGLTAVAVVIAFPPTGEQGKAAAKVNNDLQQSGSASSEPATKLQPAQQERIELERLSQQKNNAVSRKTVANAFSPTSWYVAPPRQQDPSPQPPPIPTAPPLPFTYMGRYEDPPKLLVILAIGNKMYTVSAGEVIDENYRVDRITDSAVELVYLPLNISQSISTIGVPENAQHR